jgi:tRNA nucleotidyltransferase (CCA-adding enzyme)
MVKYVNFDRKSVLNSIKPSKPEKEKFDRLSYRLIKLINKIARENNVNADAVLVGSVAKGTCLSGKTDIDIFIKFPININDYDLKKNGLFLGNTCIKKMGGIAEERYASHPYVTGIIEDVKIDLVPCYNVESHGELKSAVDRTILHTEYVKNKLNFEQIDEVLLLKKFMRSIGTYGSEFKVGGFAGYLCELLVIYYGSFKEVLKSASEEWMPGFIIDIEKYQTGNLFNDPFVVVDPVDKNRNVAAALTLQKLSEFVVASDNFIRSPSSNYFFPKLPLLNPLSIKNEFIKRGTKTLLLIFNPPDIPADALYPQLKKTEISLKNIFDRKGFGVFGSDSWTDEKNITIILIEFDIRKLAYIKKHLGPYIWSKMNSKKFLDKYKNKAYIEGDRWVVDIDRKYKTVESLFKDIINKEKLEYLRFGKHIKVEIAKKFIIMDINNFLNSERCKSDVLMFFYKYLNKSLCIWDKF